MNIEKWQDHLDRQYPDWRTWDSRIHKDSPIIAFRDKEIADLRAALSRQSVAPARTYCAACDMDVSKRCDDANCGIPDAAPQSVAVAVDAMAAMNRAKALPIWDNINHALHVELDIIFKALSAAPAGDAGAVAWQWRKKGDPWTLEKTFNSQVFATTDDSEVRALYDHPAPAAQAAPSELPPLPIVPWEQRNHGSEGNALFEKLAMQAEITELRALVASRQAAQEPKFKIAELPQPTMVHGSYDYYSTGQMRDYGQACWKQALAEADLIHKDLLRTMAESALVTQQGVAVDAEPDWYRWKVPGTECGHITREPNASLTATYGEPELLYLHPAPADCRKYCQLEADQSAGLTQELKNQLRYVMNGAVEMGWVSDEEARTILASRAIGIADPVPVPDALAATPSPAVLERDTFEFQTIEQCVEWYEQRLAVQQRGHADLVRKVAELEADQPDTAAVRDAALEDAKEACRKQNDSETWPTPLGCVAAITALQSTPATPPDSTVRDAARWRETLKHIGLYAGWWQIQLRHGVSENGIDIDTMERLFTEAIDDKIEAAQPSAAPAGKE